MTFSFNQQSVFDTPQGQIEITLSCKGQSQQAILSEVIEAYQYKLSHLQQFGFQEDWQREYLKPIMAGATQ